MIYTFFNARVNFYGILWSSTQNMLRIHIKIWFYTTLTIEELLDLRAHGRVFKQPQLPQRIRDTQPINATVWKWIYSWWIDECLFEAINHVYTYTHVSMCHLHDICTQGVHNYGEHHRPNPVATQPTIIWALNRAFYLYFLTRVDPLLTFLVAMTVLEMSLTVRLQRALAISVICICTSLQ